MDYRDRITTEPSKRGGQPCVRGSRITVNDVLQYLDGGMTVEALLADFPELMEADVRACVAYREDLIRRINAVCDEVDTAPDAFLREAARRTLMTEEW